MDWILFFGIFGLFICVFIGGYGLFCLVTEPKSFFNFSSLKKKTKKRVLAIQKRDRMELLCSRLTSLADLPKNVSLFPIRKCTTDGGFSWSSIIVFRYHQALAVIEYDKSKRFTQKLCLRVKWLETKAEKKFPLRRPDRVINYLKGKLSVYA